MIISPNPLTSGWYPHRAYLWVAALTFLLEIVIALFVHDRLVRPYLGDTLAVILVHCTVRGFTSLSAIRSLATAMAIACAIELGQLFGLLGVLGLERNLLARVALGSGFDPLDFVAYAGGGFATLVGEAWRPRAKGRGH